jgi:glycogen debranching enzyme
VIPAVTRLRRLAERFLQQRPDTDPELERALSSMTLADLNRALFRCDQEERDEGHGYGAYDIPGFGATVYCGLQGQCSGSYRRGSGKRT